MLGDQAGAQKARGHKGTETFTCSGNQAGLLSRLSSSPPLWPELLASPMGHLQNIVTSLGPWASTRPPCVVSTPGGGGRLFISAAAWVRTAPGRGRDKAASSERPSGSPEGWSPRCSGVRAGVVLNICQVDHTCYLTTDSTASISKMRLGGRCRDEPHGTGNSLSH